MVAIYLLARIAVVVGYYFLRLIPVVGRWAARSYDEQMFGPLTDSFSVSDITAARDGDEVRVTLTLANENWLDLSVAGVNLRLARDDDVTLDHVLWPPAFGTAPESISTEVVPGEGENELSLRSYVPDPDADTVSVDGSILVQPSLTVREKTFAVGRREFEIETEAAEL
ncbi:hypothetical protein [Haloarchaeobius sp. DFWS5]|uniref:hypothetical protein n=1 Tax=Haloarchaeobius sp. DFWS5 TaxID=3446114 RepID=UPI003EB8EADF